MQQINDNKAFKEAIKKLKCVQQRPLAARFVENVLALSKDERIPRVIAVAAHEQPSQDELDSALRSAKAAIIDTHCRCGADCDWEEQASYFVARAAAASVAPKNKCISGGAAWQAAVSCRMARTSAAMDGIDEGATRQESEQQFRILNEFLTSNP